MTSQFCTKNLGGEQNLAKRSVIFTYMRVLTNLRVGRGNIKFLLDLIELSEYQSAIKSAY